MESAGTRIAFLDGIRGLAVLLVVVWHYLTVGAMGLEQSWARALAALPGGAHAGVELFFVLSGFLIGSILLRERPIASALGAFAFRRWLRLYPAYVVLLSAYLILECTVRAGFAGWAQGMFVPEVSFWPYPLFLQNFPMAADFSFGPYFLAVTWTLAVEVQFYVFAMVLFAMAPRRMIVMLLALALVGAPVLRAWVRESGVLFLLPFRIDSFAWGMMAALAARSPVVADWIRSGRGVPPVLVVLTLAGWAWLMTTGPSPRSTVYVAFGAGYAWLIVYGVLRPGGTWAGIVSGRGLVFLGTISYGLYLWHEPVNWMLHLLFTGQAPHLGTGESRALTLAAFVGSVGIRRLARAPRNGRRAGPPCATTRNRGSRSVPVRAMSRPLPE